MKFPLRHLRAFTLVELLTVIAIIGILAAIIIPTVGKVRHTARRVQSISNLHGIGSACLLYANEYKNRLPWLYSNTTGGGWTGTGWQPLFWSTAIEPYLPARKTGQRSPALRCPLIADTMHHDNGDYGGNGHIFTQPDTGAQQTDISTLPKPSYTILAVSAKISNGSASWYLNQGFEDGREDTFPRPDDRGTGTWLCVFADGHAKALPVAEVSTPEQRRSLFIP